MAGTLFFRYPSWQNVLAPVNHSATPAVPSREQTTGNGFLKPLAMGRGNCRVLYYLSVEKTTAPSAKPLSLKASTRNQYS